MASVENSSFIVNSNPNGKTLVQPDTTSNLAKNNQNSLFSDWSKNELKNSLATDGSSVFAKEPEPYALTGERGQTALVDMNKIISGAPTDAAEMQRVDAEVKSTYIKDLKNVASADIKNFYDKDNDNEVTEQEYVNGEVTPEVIKSIPDDELKEDKIKLAGATARTSFALMNMDNRDGKNVVTTDEYAARLLAMDSNNSKGQLDGKITGEEYLNSDYTLNSDGTVNESQMSFMKRAASYYNVIRSN